jgi:hypothetical protein
LFYLFLFRVLFAAVLTPRPIALELEQQLHVSCIGGSVEAPIERFLQDGTISQNRMDGNAHHWHATWCWFGSLRVCNSFHVLISCLFLKLSRPEISENLKFFAGLARVAHCAVAARRRLF